MVGVTCGDPKRSYVGGSLRSPKKRACGMAAGISAGAIAVERGASLRSSALDRPDRRWGTRHPRPSDQGDSTRIPAGFGCAQAVEAWQRRTAAWSPARLDRRRSMPVRCHRRSWMPLV